jgi:hypothetical protein
MINSKVLTMVAIAAAITLLAASTVANPALAKSSSKHEFRHDVKQFNHCFRENGHLKISRSNFPDT